MDVIVDGLVRARRYTLRLNSSTTPGTGSTFTAGTGAFSNAFEKYYLSGFLSLQEAISRSILALTPLEPSQPAQRHASVGGATIGDGGLDDPPFLDVESSATHEATPHCAARHCRHLAPPSLDRRRHRPARERSRTVAAASRVRARVREIPF